MRRDGARRRWRAALVALAGAAAVLLPAAAGAAAPPADGPCTDPGGVTVVVDASELGGDVAVGCATDPATGAEALAQAGFAEVRDPSGYLCAIDGRPDPCPTEFTGSFWVYWFAAPDGAWTSYSEGPDTSTPAAGAVEGWRYGDGLEPPAVAPADVAPGRAGADSPAAPPAGVDDEEVDRATPATATATGDESTLLDGIPEAWRPVVAVAGGLVGVGAVVVVIVLLRRLTRDRGTE